MRRYFGTQPQMALPYSQQMMPLQPQTVVSMPAPLPPPQPQPLALPAPHPILLHDGNGTLLARVQILPSSRNISQYIPGTRRLKTCLEKTIVKSYKIWRMDYVNTTLLEQKEELLGLYRHYKCQTNQFCSALLLIICLIPVGLILMAILLYPFYFSFHKMIAEINSIPPHSPFQDPVA